MKKMRKYLAILLSVCMLAGTMEIPVAAAEASWQSVEAVEEVGTGAGEDVSEADVSDNAVSESVQTENACDGTVQAIDVNPHYADQVSEEYIAQWAKEVGADSATVDVAAEAVAPSEAVDVLTAGMVARQQVVEVPVKYDTAPDDIWACALELLYDAMEEDPAADGDEGDYLHWHYRGCSYGYSSSSGGTKITYKYTINYLTTAAQEQAVTDKLAEVYGELNLGVLSGEAKIGKIYDFVTNHVTYDYDHLKDGAAVYPIAWSAYGGLIDGTCVCQGYSTLTYRMMKENGISTRVITGDSGGAHAWNIVKIDSLYYNIDSTWDGYTVNDDGSIATPGQRNWYLLSMDDFGNHTRDSEYSTTEFHLTYPMAAVSYGAEADEEEELIERDNYSYTFATTNGGTVSTTATSGEYSIFIFGRVTCGYTQNFTEMLRDSGLAGNEKVRAVLVDIDQPLDSVKAYETELACDDITVCYGAESSGNSAFWAYSRVAGYTSGSVYFPTVVVIDGNNKIRYAQLSDKSLAGVKQCLGELLGYTAPVISKATVSKDGIVLTWNGVASAEKYHVYCSAQTGSAYLEVAAVTDASYTYMPPREGTYSFAVSVEYDGIESEKSSPVSVTYQTGAIKLVSLNKTSASIFSYENTTLTATVAPEMDGDAVDQTVTWSSSDESVVTVENGKLTGVKPGAATITATSAKDATKKATCVVTVKDDYTITYELNGGVLESANPTAYNPYYPALSLNKPVKEGFGFVGWYRDAAFAEDTRMENIPAGSNYGNFTLYAKWFECVAPRITSSAATLDGITIGWDAVAEADKYYVYRKTADAETYTKLGQTTEVSYLDKIAEAGTYYYVVTAEYDGIESGYSQAVEVKYNRGMVKEVVLDKAAVSVFGYESLTLSATVNPVMDGDTVEQAVTWSSSDESIATVENGKVIGVKSGKATITATSVKDTTKKATCVVTVKEDYTITYELNGGVLEKANPTAYNPYYPALTLNAPVKTDCAFLGWYRDAEFSEDTRMENIPSGSDFGNLTLYAKWKEKASVAAPTANVPSGAVEKGAKIKLSSDTLDAAIYYTLDGSNPNRNSTRYTDAITVNEAVEIRAFAVKDGFKDSETAVFSYTVKDTSADLGDVLPEDVPEDGIIPEGLWVAGVDDAVYSGKPITFDLHVYHGKKMLTLKTDYTVSYKNNKVAAEATAKKAPTVIVTGKGNYKDKVVENFTIAPLSIHGAEFTLDAATVAYNGKVQKPVPVLYRDGKKLKVKSDYKVSYTDTSEGAYVEPGVYEIILEGCGNYCDRIKTQVNITKAALMSKTKIDKIAAQPYTGEEIEPEIVVKDGKNIVSKEMYSVKYFNHKEVGTATVYVVGDGVNYVGVKTATFKITGVPMSKVKVDNLPKSVPYTGTDIELENVKLTYTAKKGEVAVELAEGVDYEVEYTRNETVGTATVIYTGLGRYAGSLKKTFKITAFDMKANQNGLITVDYEKSVPYAKGGAKPAIAVYFDGNELVAGKDYTVSYKNNKALNDGTNAKKLATIAVKGKGNFKGTATYQFTITKQDIALMDVQAADKLQSTKAGAYKSTPKVYDLDGKLLKAGTDYEKEMGYFYDEDTYLADGTLRVAGTEVGAKDIVPAGTVIRVEITGKGNYEANVVCGKYRIVKADISKASVKVNAQTYTGKAVEPGKDQIQITLKGEPLTAADYEIVSYSNNVKKGNATIVLRGVGQYGGTKTVKFTIAPKSMGGAEFLSEVQ